MTEKASNQIDGDKLEQQAHHDDNPAGKGTKKLEGKLAKHRDLIFISVSVLSVIIAYLSFTGKGKKAAASTDESNSDGQAQTDPSGAYSFDDLAGGLAYTSGSSVGIGSGTVANGDAGYGTGGAYDAPDGFSQWMQNISDQLSGLEANTKKPTPASTWVRPSSFAAAGWANEPASEPAHFLFGPAARGLVYTRNRATGATYQINPNGKPYRISAWQYASLGRPKVTDYGSAPKPAPVKKKK